MKFQSRMLGTGEQAAEQITAIEADGGIAWSAPEYGDDHGHVNVYWGERLYWFTADQVKEAFTKRLIEEQNEIFRGWMREAGVPDA